MVECFCHFHSYFPFRQIPNVSRFRETNCNPESDIWRFPLIVVTFMTAKFMMEAPLHDAHISTRTWAHWYNPFCFSFGHSAYYGYSRVIHWMLSYTHNNIKGSRVKRNYCWMQQGRMNKMFVVTLVLFPVLFPLCVIELGLFSYV